MRGKRYLAKNIGLLTISQFGTKILSFILVPLYTNVLSTEEYGTYDLFNTTILLLTPLITLNIADATLRFPLDDDNNKADIIKISLKYCSIGTLILAILLFIDHYFNLIKILDGYHIYVFLMYLVYAFSNVLVNFSRGIDEVKHVAISGLLSASITLFLNIYFLLVLKLGLNGYFLANILGGFTQILYLIIATRLWKYLSITKTNHDLQKEMIDYSKPLMANNIAWWVNSSSDRYIVTIFCGTAANGIYSVGYKIPSILNVFQTIFNQAWTLSAVKDFDPDDSNGFFTEMYNLYNASMVIVCSLLIITTKLCARLLYAKDFYKAWEYVPFLLISVLFGALSGYIGGIFAAVKDTKVFGRTTVFTAVINTVLNIVLVYFVGPIGAAIATLVSYWATWAIRVRYLKKYIRLKINIKRDYFVYTILLLQSYMLYVNSFNTTTLYFIEIILFSIIILFYHKYFRELLTGVLRRKNNGK